MSLFAAHAARTDTVVSGSVDSDHVCGALEACGVRACASRARRRLDGGPVQMLLVL